VEGRRGAQLLEFEQSLQLVMLEQSLLPSASVGMVGYGVLSLSGSLRRRVGVGCGCERLVIGGVRW